MVFYAMMLGIQSAIDIARDDLVENTVPVLREGDRDILGRLAEDRGDLFVFPDDTAGDLLMCCTFPVDLLQGHLKDVRKRPVADVVEQGGVTKGRKVVALYLQLPRREGGDVQDAERMLETRVACGRVDQVYVGKLLDPAQSL